MPIVTASVLVEAFRLVLASRSVLVHKQERHGGSPFRSCACARAWRGLKTYKIDLPAIAKADRQHDRANGRSRSRPRPLPDAVRRRSPWRKKVSGQVDRRAP
jgi:hypothetical protein